MQELVKNAKFQAPLSENQKFQGEGRGGQGPAINVLSSFPRTFSRPTKSKNHGSNVSECVDYVLGTVLNNLLLNSLGFIMVLSQRRAPFSRWEWWSRVTYVAHLKSEAPTAQRCSVKLRSLPTVLACGDALTSGHSRWNAAQNTLARTHSKCVIF